MEYKRIINLSEDTPYDTSKDLIWKKEESKCNNMIQKLKKSDYLWWCYKKKQKKHNSNWLQNRHHPHRLLI